jgi:hypothetical protein
VAAHIVPFSKQNRVHEVMTLPPLTMLKIPMQPPPESVTIQYCLVATLGLMERPGETVPSGTLLPSEMRYQT